MMQMPMQPQYGLPPVRPMQSPGMPQMQAPQPHPLMPPRGPFSQIGSGMGRPMHGLPMMQSPLAL